MGIFSIFKVTKEEKIKRLKAQIENTQRTIEGLNNNIDLYKRQGSPKYYIDGARTHIKQCREQIKWCREQIKELK